MEIASSRLKLLEVIGSRLKLPQVATSRRELLEVVVQRQGPAKRGTPKYIISKGGVLIPQTGPGHGGGAHLVAGSNFPSPGCRIADGFFFDFFRFGHFRSREGSGWTGFVKLVTNHCLTACGDHSRSVSCNICPFLVVRGSTAHPPGRQVRVLNHWAAARRSRPLSSRPPPDLLSTSPRPPLDLSSTSPRPLLDLSSTSPRPPLDLPSTSPRPLASLPLLPPVFFPLFLARVCTNSPQPPSHPPVGTARLTIYKMSHSNKTWTRCGLVFKAQICC